MKTWLNTKTQIVSLFQLEKACADISGTCHRFAVIKTTPNRVYVQYSNPNEYGSEYPMDAVFPSYPSSFDKSNPNVVLDIIDVKHDNWDGEGWQAFQTLLDYDWSKNPND